MQGEEVAGVFIVSVSSATRGRGGKAADLRQRLQQCRGTKEAPLQRSAGRRAESAGRTAASAFGPVGGSELAALSRRPGGERLGQEFRQYFLGKQSRDYCKAAGGIQPRGPDF